MLQAIFFDRDGTLGGDGHFCHPSDFQLYPETERALGLARAAGVKLFAFTNQNRISLGQATLAEFEAEFQRLGFDGAYVCPHGAGEGCACRKPTEGTTSVHGYCFQDGKLLLVDLKSRGWDIPGGHVDPGEMPEAAFRREVWEEGYIQGGACTPLGYVIVDHSQNPNWRAGGRYPQIGYQAFYHMPVTEVLPFDDRFESAQRIFVDAADVPKYYHGWTGLGQHILRAAVAVEAKAR